MSIEGGNGSISNVDYHYALDSKIHGVHLKKFLRESESGDTFHSSNLLKCYIIHISNLF